MAVSPCEHVCAHRSVSECLPLRSVSKGDCMSVTVFANVCVYV